MRMLPALDPAAEDLDGCIPGHRTLHLDVAAADDEPCRRRDHAGRAFVGDAHGAVGIKHDTGVPGIVGGPGDGRGVWHGDRRLHGVHQEVRAVVESDRTGIGIVALIDVVEHARIGKSGATVVVRLWRREDGQQAAVVGGSNQRRIALVGAGHGSRRRRGAGKNSSAPLVNTGP